MEFLSITIFSFILNFPGSFSEQFYRLTFLLQGITILIT